MGGRRGCLALPGLRGSEHRASGSWVPRPCPQNVSIMVSQPSLTSEPFTLSLGLAGGLCWPLGNPATVAAAQDPGTPLRNLPARGPSCLPRR